MPEMEAAMGDAEPFDLEAVLPRFGLSAFRPGQRDVIEAVIAGQDILCVMPTGGGKSLCYQLPAVARGGLTLVVSPLISLMKDQVDQLHALGLRATLINSTLDPSEQSTRIEEMQSGAYELVYCAAERFRSSRFIEAVNAAKVRLLAIDEAHCISEWGHDFRPDYSRLGRARARIGNPPTIALTATATQAVRQDIIAQLNLRQPRTFVTGFARPNLSFEVQHPNGTADKDDALIGFLNENPGSGIVYVSSRKRCEEVAATIAARTRRRVGIYHAGMLNEDRRAAQEAFMQGRVEVVVATNAFGMGIDKRDVRFVVHYNLPGTLEAYYQEAGRAGRDGLPSRCLLLFSYVDRMIQEYFIEGSNPSRAAVLEVYEFLKEQPDDPIELTQLEIKDNLESKLSAEGVGACERLLEKAGVLERLEPRQNMAVVRIDSDLPTLVDLLPKQATAQRRVLQALERMIGVRRNEHVYFQPKALAQSLEMEPVALSRTLRELKHLRAFDYVPPFRGRGIHFLDRETPFFNLQIDFETLAKRKADEYEKLDRVIDFANTRDCRQLEILNYFGQPNAQPCGRCDNCHATTPHAKSVRPAELDAALLQAVRIVLSGVARTQGRFGKLLVVQMLCGSDNAKIRKFHLNALSTYGLLAHLEQREAIQFFDELILAGCIEQVEVDRFRPLVQLTELGRDVMLGKRALQDSLNLSAALLAKLRQPPPDTTPHTTVENDLGETPAPPQHDAQPAAALEEAKHKLPEQPGYYWTWRLLAGGFTVEECAAIRAIDHAVVLDHALRAIDAGYACRAEWFLPTETIAAMRAIIGSTTPQQIRPILAKLPRGTRDEHVQWFLKTRDSGTC